MARLKILKPDFFNRKTLVVAKDLLGKYLVRKNNSKIKRYKITEVEAYIGPHDLACHSSKGRTPRTEIMFKSAGHFYVYLTYGMHHMFNIVTEAKDYPAAVLIRGVENISGPGRLTRALSITKDLNGKLAISKSGLWLEDRGEVIKSSQIKRTPRIGINYAGPIWTPKPYRFVLKEKKD